MEARTKTKSNKKFKMDYSVNIWEHWKSEKNQNHDELRSEAFEEFINSHQSLTLQKMRLSNVPSIFPYGLKELNVSYNKLTRIPDNLPETLEILNVEFNYVCIIPEKLPSNLRELHLSSNNITIVPETLPDSLTVLNLSHNKITTLSKTLPKMRLSIVSSTNFPNGLKELNLSFNKITIIPENLPETLQILNVSANEVPIIPEKLPSSLRELDASSNKITNIPKTWPDSITILNLSSNKISTLSNKLSKRGMSSIVPNIFPCGLKELDLSHNELTEIPENLPNTLEILKLCGNQGCSVSKKLPSNLRELHLSSNNITNGPETLPYSLTVLNLSQNKIKKIVSNIFPNGLKELNVSFNKLTSLPENLPDTLEILNVAANELSVIPKKLSSNLKKLYMYSNKITIIPETLPDSIRILDLSCNLITTLPNNIPKRLRSLGMCYNQLSCLPENLPDSLETLRISSNRLTNLPNNLPESLETLWASSNRIINLPSNLPKSLRKLDVGNNIIKVLPATLPEMLEEIKICYNNLVRLPKRLPKSLKKLSMGNNNLTKVKIDSDSIIELNLECNEIEIIEYFNLTKLQILIISSNELTHLPKNLPETIKYLDASYNNLSIILKLPQSLQYLNLMGNKITTLPKSLPPLLKEICLMNNKLREIPLEIPALLSELQLTNNLITDVPSSIENTPDVEINLRGNQISKTSLEYLQQLMRNTNRPLVLFDEREMYEEYVKTKPLIEELSNWLNIQIHPYWNGISEEVRARSFSFFLYKMRENNFFAIPQFKEDMTEWLCSLVGESDSKRKIREMVFLWAEEAGTGHCSSRIEWTLHQIMIFWTVSYVESGIYDNKIPALIRVARRMYRLNLLNKIARDTVRDLEKYGNMDRDEVDIYLEYQIRLSEILRLPIKQWQIDRNFKLSDSHIYKVINKIRYKESTEFIDYLLLDWQPWKEVLKRWNCEKFKESENIIKNEELFQLTFDIRKAEYQIETKMSNLPLEIEIQLGTQVKRSIEKSVWFKLTIECLQNKQLNLETMI